MKRLLVIFLIGNLCTTTVYAQDNIIEVKQGQTVVEDMVWPSNNEIEEAQKYLSENHIDVPEDIEELCIYYGEKNDIVPELLEAVIWKESRFKTEVVDPTGTCKGLMQIKSSSHSKRMGRLKVNNIFDPAGNIAVGSDYLRELLEDNDVEKALMLYNGDTSNTISPYVEEILKVSQALERVHWK